MSSTARDREPVEQLEGDRRQAGRRDPGDRVARALERREEGEHRRARRRRGAEPQRRLGDDPERALAADEQVGQRVAGDVLDVPAARPDDRPVGHDDLERQDRVARLAVLDAAQAAGVRAEVAADRAHLEAGRVGRVEQALARRPRPSARALMMPGWTTATRFSRSISRIRSIAVNAIVRPPSIPAAPPDRPLPAPRGTIGTRARRRSGPARRPRRSSSGRPPRRAGPAAGRASRRGGTTRGRSASVSSRRPGSRRGWRRRADPDVQVRRSRRCLGRGRHGRSLRGAPGERAVGVRWPRWPACLPPSLAAVLALPSPPPVPAARAAPLARTRAQARRPSSAPPPAGSRPPASESCRARSDARASRSTPVRRVAQSSTGPRADLGRLDGDDPQHLGRRRSTASS